MTALILLLILLTACASATPTPPPRAVIEPMNAPPWQSADVPINVTNVAQIAYLGRLDQPDIMATVFAYTVSPDGLNLVGLTDQEIIQWDLLTGARIFTTARVDAVRVMFASDKESIYLVDVTGAIRSMDVRTSADLYQASGHTAYAGVSAFAPDFDLIALGGSDGTIKLWDMVTRESRLTIDAADATITALVFTPDATRVVSADQDGWRRVWDTETGDLITEQRDAVLGTRQLITTALLVASDGAQIAGVNDSGILLWTIGDSSASIPLSAGRGGRPSLVRWSADGRWLLSGTSNDGLALWDVNRSAFVGTLPNTQGDRVDADFSPDGTLLLTSALDGTVRLWDLSNPSDTSTRASQLPIGTSTIFGVEWTDDGRALLLFDANGAIYLWGIGDIG